MVSSVIKFYSDITGKLYDHDDEARIAEVEYQKISTMELIKSLESSTYFNLAINASEIWPHHPNAESDLASLHRQAMSAALSSSPSGLDRKAFGIVVDPTMGTLRADRWNEATDFNRYYQSHEFMYIQHMWYITTFNDQHRIIDHIKRIDSDLYNALTVLGQQSVFNLDKGLVFVDRMCDATDSTSLSYMICMNTETLITSMMNEWRRTLSTVCPIFGPTLTPSGGQQT